MLEKYEEEEEFRKYLMDPVTTVEEKEEFLKKSFDFVSEDALKIVNYIERSSAAKANALTPSLQSVSACACSLATSWLKARKSLNKKNCTCYAIFNF